VLQLSHCEVWLMPKAKLAPAGGPLRLMPAGGARRTNQHPLKRAYHGVPVETRFGRSLGHRVYNKFFEAADHERNLNW
jgi:hypothetical protein